MKKRKGRSRKTQDQLALKEPSTKPILRKRAKKRRKTQHRLALKKATTRQLVGRLNRYWDLWDEIERGELLHFLTKNKDHQCSVRGLANDLGKKETTLRHYIMLSQLPAEERKKFKEGETAKLVLARKVARDRERAIADRIAEERRSDALSYEVAEVILDFVLSKRKDPDTLIMGAEPDYLIMKAAIPGLLENVRQIICGSLAVRPETVKLPSAYLVDSARPNILRLKVLGSADTPVLG